jgi:predicted alpha/beta-fold hydrolase
MLAVLRKWFINARYKRQLLTAPDGGVFAIDWFRGSNRSRRIPANAPIVLVAHALCGKPQPEKSMYLHLAMSPMTGNGLESCSK